MDLVRNSRLPDRNLSNYSKLEVSKLRDILRRPDVGRVESILEGFQALDRPSPIYLASSLVKGYKVIPLVAILDELYFSVQQDLDGAQGVRFGKQDFSVDKPEVNEEVISSATRSYVLRPSLSLWESIPGVMKPANIILGIRAES